MNQSAKVRAIYQELRQAVGMKASAAEMLACAASLVELFSLEEGVPACELNEGRQPHDVLPVDVALADGGVALNLEWSRLGWEARKVCGGRQTGDWQMKALRFEVSMAANEHLLAGHSISRLEAIALFQSSARVRSNAIRGISVPASLFLYRLDAGNSETPVSARRSPPASQPTSS